MRHACHVDPAFGFFFFLSLAYSIVMSFCFVCGVSPAWSTRRQLRGHLMGLGCSQIAEGVIVFLRVVKKTFP